MALVRNINEFLKHHFLFRGSEIILQNGNLPDETVLRKCFSLQVASDWFNDVENDYSAVELEENCPVPAGCSPISLWSFFWELKDDDGLIFKASRARALLNFRNEFRYCSSCGGALKDDAHFTARTCAQCGRIYFPQIEPAVIMLVKKGDEILLARHRNRKSGVYTCLAGFVESGETLENAVIREVREETGINVCNVRYAASQSWPYPDQLMCAFFCDYKDGEIKIQEDELLDAKWFKRSELPEIPKPGSVAYNLITGRWD